MQLRQFHCTHILGLWFGLSVIFAVASLYADEPKKKSPLPDAAAQAEASKLIAELFKPDYDKAKTPEQKVALAKRLLGEGVATKEDAAGRFVLLRTARDIATGQGDVALAFEAVQQIATWYEVDGLQMKLDAATAGVKSLKTPKAQQACAELLVPLVDEAVSANRYDLAKSTVVLALGCAKQGRDGEQIKQLTSKGKELAGLTAEFEKTKAALTVLESKPVDPGANLAVGRFFCFAKGDWQRGIPMLALCNDEALHPLARLELSEKPDPLKLGDEWWKCGESQEGQAKISIQVHAAAWYQQALPELSGLAKVKVERRIAEAKAASPNKAIPATGKPSGVKPEIATGSYPWPKDAPPPAIAPFDARQAKAHQEAWAKHLKVPVEYTNSIGMKFILIPPGEFTMGSTPAEIEEALKFAGDSTHWQAGIKSEGPQHRVILTQPIYLGVHEVTQRDYQTIMGKNPSHFANTGDGKDAVARIDTSTFPADSLSWNEAAEFCARLSLKEKRKPFYFRSGETVTLAPGNGYRLPTEAEWEFGSRAGTITKYWSGDKDDGLSAVAWFSSNSGGRTHTVGERKANPFGLYDTCGNVWEWVQDPWDPAYYSQVQEKPVLDPLGPSSGVHQRIIRGGSYIFVATACRASSRHTTDEPTHRYSNVGFRAALAVDAARARRP